MPSSACCFTYLPTCPSAISALVNNLSRLPRHCCLDPYLLYPALESPTTNSLSTHSVLYTSSPGGIVGEGSEQQVGQGKTVSQSHTQNTPRQLKSSLEADVEIYLSESSGSKVADLLRRESKRECKSTKNSMLTKAPEDLLKKLLITSDVRLKLASADEAAATSWTYSEASPLDGMCLHLLLNLDV